MKNGFSLYGCISWSASHREFLQATDLLHFRRTFVEKMFAIHAKVEILKRDRAPLGTYARHYYDLFQLAAQADVIAMLKSDEYDEIKKDYDAISREYFSKAISILKE